MRTNKTRPADTNAFIGRLFKKFIMTLVDKSVSLWTQGLSLLRFNIAFKLSLGYSIHVTWLFAFVLASANLAFDYYLVYDIKQSLNDDRSFLTASLKTDPKQNDSMIQAYLKSRGIDYALLNDKGEILYTSTPMAFMKEDLQVKPVPVAEVPFLGPYLVQVPAELIPWEPAIVNEKPIYNQSKIQLADGRPADLVIRDQRYSAIALRENLWIGSLIAFLLLSLSSSSNMSRMVRRQLKPIHVMTAQVREISGKNLETRLNVSGTKDELKDLALTFNQMLEAIQQHYVREKQFVSDVSHELRTPIAVIKGYGNLLNRWGKTDTDVLEESIQAITGEADYMQQLVEDLLFVARNETAQADLEFTEVDLSQVMAEVERETRLIDTKHVITATIQQNIFIQGSAEKIKQAIRIFVDNSQKYTPEGGEITLTLRSSSKHAIIVIKDQGIGISKEDLPHVFERFYRADKSRTREGHSRSDGVGLGLSIAAIILQQHHGIIHPESKLGEGTTMSLLIPLKG